MMEAKIQSFSRVVPMIYAYNTPGVTYHEGWTKIGYTEKQTVSQRIKQQTHTAGIQYQLAWQDNAIFKDGSGEYFTDHDFHSFLESQMGVERTPGTEWFHVDGPTSHRHFDAFSRRELVATSDQRLTYELRKEQREAVSMTKAYFENGGEEFLWNAKPRFGKTLTSYDLVRQMGFTKVLIVTNRPSIANSWADDFFKFIGWRGEFSFVSDTDALKDKPGVLSREEHLAGILHREDSMPRNMITFESLQGLKGSVYFGGQYDKLRWMSELEFDLLIVDEAQEGVDTMKTERAFRNIKRKHTLYLSGTPFKQLASEQFSKEQIFNWSYADEQEAKANWSGEDANPYETLPRLAMFTYQLSGMIRERIEKGLDLSGEDGTVDYAFDLNEFFATDERGKFVHEDEIKRFLHALTTQEKYPFSTPELRRELSHTMWYLNRVASAKALEKLLREDEVFREYKVVLAAGDGRSDDDDAQAAKAFDQVKAAIANYDKTITLTVGQLTVGVTIPEWSGVLMLCNMKSPSSYMQAAFRAQNPCIVTRDSQRFRKETAYVFDFDPARTLIIFDEFANNLSADTVGGRGTSDDRKENIKRLLNFFPVLGEDSEGRMVELDAASVLSIPRRLKSQEVVRRGFMSNFLFQNISNIFGAPAVVREIVEKLTPAHEEGKKADPKRLDSMDTVTVDENGEVEIPNETIIGRTQDLFGPKVYEIADIQSQMETVAENASIEAVDQHIRTLTETVKAHIKENVVAPAAEGYGMKKGAQNRLEKQVEQDIDRAFQKIQGDYEQQTRIAKAELERKQQAATTAQEVKQAETDYAAAMDSALKSFVETVQETVQQTVEEKPKEVVEQAERHKAEQEKQSVEDEVRAHLRGFSRTIPSFIMAYGDGNLTLANFDDYTEDDVFLEVTGITMADFRFLRDGGEYTDPETGESKHFEGHLFDEVVFNDSVAEFWNKKQQLADYFDERQDEDIFDYIPPQKTNQIFTPRWVVSMMVDQLEENNPGCFDDPTKTFADLYMKSGLYITEIVKRLYRSEGLKATFPDEKERIRHILQKQVYGMAPTRIIYLIATNYILGFDEALKDSTHNFVQADAAEAAKAGTLDKLVDRHFGRLG
ncbi:restriction endonuclease [Pseudoflavonifractor sp. 524-17]|uniref:DEAD/DEAH box helicase family protein n=1 Tax=Pseudoflavonifractor sp. 524-17 TaxID=2304577 RepID=UPI001379E2D5|nr:DEAD/DEAH box helicase family protein [Pseudoflavonifractor sp. 524-17]NCE63521.1 restriction endonuclease [Pseudoflavonifractor sp. 524-17]